MAAAAVLQRIHHLPEPLDLGPLARLLPPELRAGPVVPYSPPWIAEVEREGERRERGPAGRGHSG